MRKKTITLLTLGPLLVGALGFGCHVYNEKHELVPGSLVKYNHHYIQGVPIQDYAVRLELDGKTISEASGYGGGRICCVSVPKYWNPRMKATVFWTYGTEPPDAIPHTAESDIPEYSPETVGNVHLHFFANDKVKVVVTQYDLGHPYYPLPKEEWAPWKLHEYVIDYLREEKDRGLLPAPKIERVWGKQWGMNLYND